MTSIYGYLLRVIEFSECVDNFTELFCMVYVEGREASKAIFVCLEIGCGDEM
jgi:hypothetical protein